MAKDRTLSRRCLLPVSEESDFLDRYLSLHQGDSYDKKTNPEGCINLGIAVNGIHSEIVKQKFLSTKLDACTSMYEYFPEHGIPRLQKAMAEYMTTFFETPRHVQPENIYFMTSGNCVIDVLAHCLADPQDVFLGVTPIYQGVVHGFNTRSLVEIWPIALDSKRDAPFHLTLNDVEEAYRKALEAGKRVRGMILLNPGNPVGYVIEVELLDQILDFCCRHELHFISDEVYAMSIHDPEVSFHSVLKFPSLPDPDRTHVVYAVSKDLGLTKLRVGVLHTFNKALQHHLTRMANFQCVAYPVMEVLAKILEDREWCRSLFNTAQGLMRSRYISMVQKLEQLNLHVHRTPAAIYLWVNFEHYCQPLTFESEERLFSRMIQEAKVILYPGTIFKATQPGWFRILFTLDEETVQKGIQRLEVFLLKLDKNPL